MSNPFLRPCRDDGVGDLEVALADKSLTGSKTALFTLRRHTAEIHHAALCDRGKNHDPGKDVKKDLT